MIHIHAAIRHEPDPDHPGWLTWDVHGEPSFNASLGRLLVRRGEPGFGWCRIFPDESHRNLGNALHGGAIMTFIDLALYAGGAMAGARTAPAVTLDCSVQFLAPGRLGAPVDAEVQLLRETGRLVFLRGRILQAELLVASFAGSLRKLSAS